MSNYARFLNITYRTWWVIFFVIQALLLILMGASIGANAWVKGGNNQEQIIEPELILTDPGNSVYDADKFQGSLFMCTDGCSQNYGWLAEKWCNYYNDQKDLANSIGLRSDYLNGYKSVCGMFLSLYIGSGVFIIFEVIAIISIFVWASAMICYWRKVNCLWLTYCCSGCMWASHYIALIIYMGFTRSTFNGDCNFFPSDGTRPKLCASAGPKLSLSILILIPFIVIFYCVVSCKVQRNYGYGAFDKHFEKKLQENQVIPLDQGYPVDFTRFQHAPYGQNPYAQPVYTQPGVVLPPQHAFYPPQVGKNFN